MEYSGEMSTEAIWLVPEISCGHCVAAIEQAVTGLDGVEAVAVDLERKRVMVRGQAPPDAVAEAIVDAGYEPTRLTQP